MPTRCQAEAPAHGGGVIFLEGCHHDGVLIDSPTTTPCLIPEAPNPNCATQVTNKGPEANSSCIFIRNVDLTAAAFLAALYPRALFNTEMEYYGPSIQRTPFRGESSSRAVLEELFHQGFVTVFLYHNIKTFSVEPHWWFLLEHFECVLYF